MEIRQADPASADGRAIIAALTEEIARRYPPEEILGASADELAEAKARFFIGWEQGRAIACGSFVAESGYAEMKRIFVRPEVRGRGLGAAIVAQLEAAARAEGIALMRLETGNYSPEAVKTYERAGYGRRGPFGAYADLPMSIFMEKLL